MTKTAAVIDLKAEQRARALAAADQRMRAAKEKFSVAALSCLRGEIGADVLVAAALREASAE